MHKRAIIKDCLEAKVLDTIRFSKQRTKVIFESARPSKHKTSQQSDGTPSTPYPDKALAAVESSPLAQVEETKESLVIPEGDFYKGGLVTALIESGVSPDDVKNSIIAAFDDLDDILSIDLTDPRSPQYLVNCLAEANQAIVAANSKVIESAGGGLIGVGTSVGSAISLLSDLAVGPENYSDPVLFALYAGATMGALALSILSGVGTGTLAGFG